MSQPKLSINIKNGGLSRKAQDETPISGLLFYNAVMPLSGWTSSGNTVKIGSVAEAELTYGITENSSHSVEWFQINQFFYVAPNSPLYLGIYPTGSTYTYNEIKTMQNKAEGKIRRIGIQMNSETGITTEVSKIQVICETLYNEDKPLYVIFAPNSLSMDITTAPDLRTLNSKYVSVMIGQDSSNKGYSLSVTKNYSVTALGQLLGFNSSSPVNLNIGWVGEYDFTVGAENSSVKIGSSDFWNLLPSTLDTLNDKGYMYLKKFTGLPGTYLNDMPTCSAIANNDYAYIPEVNTMLTAIRGVRTYVLPLVNSPILMNADGTMSIVNCKNFENKAGLALTEMLEKGSISNFKTFCDPDQDVLSTSTIEIVIAVQPTATARWINVSIGFKSKI